MEIATGEGEYIKIPFSQLTYQKIVKPAETSNLDRTAYRAKNIIGLPV
jgi:hypothetical protein